MNILAIPIIIPSGDGGYLDPTQFHKIIIALSIVLFVIMMICLIVGVLSNKKYAKRYGWEYVWKEVLGILCFIAIGYAIYGIYLLL